MSLNKSKKPVNWADNYKYDWCDRILYFMKLRKIKRITLANNCYVSYSALTLWLTRKRVPSLEMIIRIARTLNVTPEWLIFGIHTEDYFTPADLELLDLIKNCNEEHKSQIKNFLLNNSENIITSKQNNKQDNSNNIFNNPIYNNNILNNNTEYNNIKNATEILNALQNHKCFANNK